MRCSCCDRNLNNYELTLKHQETGAFMDTCMKCLKEINSLPETHIPTVGNVQFNPYENAESEDEEYTGYEED